MLIYFLDLFDEEGFSLSEINDVVVIDLKTNPESDYLEDFTSNFEKYKTDLQKARVCFKAFHKIPRLKFLRVGVINHFKIACIHTSNYCAYFFLLANCLTN